MVRFVYFKKPDSLLYCPSFIYLCFIIKDETELRSFYSFLFYASFYKRREKMEKERNGDKKCTEFRLIIIRMALYQAISLARRLKYLELLTLWLNYWYLSVLINRFRQASSAKNGQYSKKSVFDSHHWNQT